jgi:iron(III) transport system permease protein
MVIFSLCLYPYIYLLSQQAFSTLSSRFTQASQVLGYRFSQPFRKLILPLSAPWVGSGLLLVLMETLADYGGVSAFNYDTITTTIYKSWFGLGSIEAAMALSTWLMLPALGLMGVSRCLKGKKRFDSIEPMMAFQKIRLSKPMALLAWGVCALMFFFVFALPLFQLMYWSLSQFNSDHVMLNVDDVIHSVLQSLIVSGLIVALAFLISASLRYPKAWDRWFVSISLLGYGIPGTIVAVMVFKSFTFLDHVLWLPYLAPLLNQEGVLLSSTLMALVAGLVCRYFSVGFSSVDSQMEHIHPDLKAASHVLGANARRTMLSVYAPLTQKACGIAFVMVFVDIMKEMPITLMTRPMGWNTLSVRVYEFTAEGDWERAAWPALILVAVGMLPLAVIHGFNKSR